MEKIHNNLNIENLIKTEWFNQFSNLQKTSIIYGIKDNVDVSIYAKKEFQFHQMEEIRLGLKNKIDVSVYANPDFDEE